MSGSDTEIRIRCSNETWLDFWDFRKQEGFESHEAALNALLEFYEEDPGKRPTAATQ